MKARFLADADLRGSILRGVQRRESKIDFEFLPRILEGLPDPEVLALAASRNRVLVSHDRATMPAAFYDFIARQSSPGLILVNQSARIGQAVEDLLLCWHLMDGGELMDQIIYLPF
ncbi:MAG TPA: DUF5615 family PIN-like protein [Bryobacteraceae bacterium]